MPERRTRVIGSAGSPAIQPATAAAFDEPATCTIRIFNLGGDLIRTLQKTDPNTSLFTWDVLTENQLPVGSGVYIYQIDAPGVGQVHGRMIVFMEKERLNNF